MRSMASMASLTARSVIREQLSTRSVIARKAFQSQNVRHASQDTPSPSHIIRPLVPPPDARSGPLLERRPDRALPELGKTNTWLKTLPIFIILITASSLAIFNYQKSSSSTVNSVLYALRTNKSVRDILGDEIYFASKIPWIKGELNPMQGNIDISFWVKGTKGVGETKFVSVRKKRDSYFETLEWSLSLPDGRVIQLLDGNDAHDPMGVVVKE